ncbi:prostaglandin reductase 2-like isoform X2 [Ptychodera flava]|uniref:prostaglandin reductase 2-like isoform X2 n=1 Tax=Ptychodera flava TaxID=63121 RepID=UPI00396A4F86
MTAANQKVVLRSRPGKGENNPPRESNFALKDCPYPEVEDGQILVKTLYLSADPYMRCQMNANTGTDYLHSFELGQVIEGNGVGVVLTSKAEDFNRGDIVESYHWPWQLYATLNVGGLNCLTASKVDRKLVGSHFSLVHGLYGPPGLAALIGIREKGHVDPNANQTFVVSAAAGACGSLAGQVARLEGCANVVGICGTDEKCCFITNDLGFDHGINYKTEDIHARLQETCPNGIDIYFDNVGGDITNAVIKHMNPNSHIILCGTISTYNSDLPYPPPLPDDVQQVVESQNITRDRFLVINYIEKFPKSIKQLSQWYKSGKLKVRETIEGGLANCPKAFISMMNGGNTGKQIVHIAYL